MFEPVKLWELFVVLICWEVGKWAGKILYHKIRNS